MYVDRNRDGSLPLITSSARKFCAIRLTEVLHAMKHHYGPELSDFSAKLLMQQTPNTNMTIFKDCFDKFYEGPLPCTKSVTTVAQDADTRETQTLVRHYEELNPNELKKQRAVLFPASYLDNMVSEPTLGDYKAVRIETSRKHGLYPVNLHEEITGATWRGYRVLPGFEHVDFEVENNGSDDEFTNYVNEAVNSVEHEVKRPRFDGDAFELEELQEYMEGDEDETYGGQENQDPQDNNPFNEGNQNLQRPFCYACQAGLGNQMAHVGGCIPDN